MTWWRTSRRVRGRARMVRGVPQTKSPRRVPFLETEQEREGKRRPWSGWRRERGSLLHLHPAAWDPPARDTRRQSAEPTRIVRVVRGRSGTSARTVCYLFQNIQYCPSPHEPRGQSASPWRTVRQERTDSPAHRRGLSDLPFFFSLIYSEIKI
jgi:hypothetical protein